jgi:hypothetical protein
MSTEDLHLVTAQWRTFGHRILAHIITTVDEVMSALQFFLRMYKKCSDNYELE